MQVFPGLHALHALHGHHEFGELNPCAAHAEGAGRDAPHTVEEGAGQFVAGASRPGQAGNAVAATRAPRQF